MIGAIPAQQTALQLGDKKQCIAVELAETEILKDHGDSPTLFERDTVDTRGVRLGAIGFHDRVVAGSRTTTLIVLGDRDLDVTDSNEVFCHR